MSTARLEIHPKLKNCAYQTFEEKEHYLDILSPFARIYYVLEGKGRLVFYDKTVHLVPGQLYLIPSFTRCSYYFDPGLIQYYIHLDTSCSNGMPMVFNFQLQALYSADALDGDLIKKLIDGHPLHALPNKKPQVYQKEHWIRTEMGYSSPANHLQAQGILLKLLSGFVLGLGKKQMPHQPSSLIPVLKYIDDNIDRVLKMDELELAVNMNKRQLSGIFQDVFDLSPNTYILTKRLEKSCLLIKTSQKKLHEIAEACGFKSYSYFCKRFQHYFGQTPLTYKKSLSYKD